MVSAPPAPTVPVPEGWIRVEESTDRPFEAGPVGVVARTVVFEDAAGRARVPNADGPWRFAFASRLAVHPTTPPTSALTRLVARGAALGFQRRLRERGFAGVRRAGTRTLAVDGGVAEVVRYEATVSLGGVRLRADAHVALRRDGDAFLLVGGAYPREVVGGDGDRAATLSALVDPERFRAELFRVIRETT